MSEGDTKNPGSASWRAGGVAVVLLLLGVTACEKNAEVVEGIPLAGDLFFSIPTAELIPVDEEANLWSGERQLILTNGGSDSVRLTLPRQEMVVTSPGGRTVTWKTWDSRTEDELAPGQALTIDLGRFGGEDPSPEVVVQLAVEIEGVIYPITVRSEPAIRRGGAKTP